MPGAMSREPIVWYNGEVHVHDDIERGDLVRSTMSIRFRGGGSFRDVEAGTILAVLEVARWARGHGICYVRAMEPGGLITNVNTAVIEHIDENTIGAGDDPG